MSGELVPVDPFHGYLEDMSEAALARLPDEFEFQVLERWFSDQTQLTFRQQAEDIMEFCERCREHGIEVRISAGPFDTHRLFRFSRPRSPKHRKPTPEKAPTLPDPGVIDI